MAKKNSMNTLLVVGGLVAVGGLAYYFRAKILALLPASMKPASLTGGVSAPTQSDPTGSAPSFGT